MSWKPMDTAPKDGTVIVLYAVFPSRRHLFAPDVFHAFYKENESHWDAVFEDAQIRRTPLLRDLAVFLGWMEVPIEAIRFLNRDEKEKND